jgi:tetraacyldisaccharide 4'-kinase
MITSPLNRALLFAPAKLYEFGVRTRIALYQTEYKTTRRLSAPTISVGNITLGGTGKTPLVAFLAGYLRDEGYAVAVLSRGYKRRSRGRVEVSTDEQILVDAEAAGDEPLMIARTCPGVRVIVDADRAAAGAWLSARANVSAFILDDGFQHLQLARDLNLVLLDATDPVGGGEMVPFGRLREPLTGLKRADAVVVTRSDQPFDQDSIAETIARYCRANTPVFYAYHDLTRLRRLDREGQARPADFAYRRAAMLAGIANPERFRADLEHFAIRIVWRRDFPDHHRYREDEFAELAASAHSSGAEAILTTEKDAMNLPEQALKATPLPVFAAQIEFRCEDEIALKALTLRALSRRK